MSLSQGERNLVHLALQGGIPSFNIELPEDVTFWHYASSLEVRRHGERVLTVRDFDEAHLMLILQGRAWKDATLGVLDLAQIFAQGFSLSLKRTAEGTALGVSAPPPLKGTAPPLKKSVLLSHVESEGYSLLVRKRTLASLLTRTCQ
jgi:hypothetical protein